MQIFQADRYGRLAREGREGYAAAQPFPHAVIDNFLPPEVCERVLGEFPDRRAIDWLRFERHHSKKLATQGDDQFGPFTRKVLHQLNGAASLQFLQELTGIGGLIPDPYFEGGGLHQIERGGHLKVHIDFNHHRRLNLDRRINLIVYLNKDWREEYNGHLELWDRDMSRCVRRVLPVFNRCVVFSTTECSYHGHPEALNCPPGMTRKSLALYYYTSGRPAEEQARAHGTLWQERPSRGRPMLGACARALHNLAAVAERPARLMRQMATLLG